ncbi:DUF3618 domain-containing protein [Pendulispora albinea]|uniref:DUF3618 domain-containing protein n=1 Tax=Pendulispora albinea TaxID=2741071 RepID=A0ABZ2LZT9_9BACT
MSMDKPSPTSHDKGVKELSEEIEHTRGQMSTTIQALEQRLSPAEIKAALHEGISEAKDALEKQIQVAKGALHEEIVEAKGAVKEQLHEAKEIVTKGASDAREALKKDINTAIANTKQSVRDATIGRVENIATQAGDFMNTTRDTLVDTVRQNPIPAAIAGIGIAWLLMNRSTSHHRRRNPLGGALNTAGAAVRGAAHDATDAVRSAVGHGVEAAEHLAGATGRLAHDATEATGHLVHDAADTAGHFAHDAQRSLESSMQSNPLALGAVAVIAGVAVGYSLPRTQKEDQLMGEVRDRVLGGAAHMAHDAAQTLQHVVGDVHDKAKEALGADHRTG